MAFVLTTTLTAAVLNITENFLPKKNYLLTSISALLIVLVLAVTIESLVAWIRLLRNPQTPEAAPARDHNLSVDVPD
jgi:multisubunit Na+/H+ antiporter MnhE subunit